MPTLEQLQKEIDDLNRLKASLKRQYDGEVGTVKVSLDMVKEAKDNYDKTLKEAQDVNQKMAQKMSDITLKGLDPEIPQVVKDSVYNAVKKEVKENIDKKAGELKDAKKNIEIAIDSNKKSQETLEILRGDLSEASGALREKQADINKLVEVIDKKKREVAGEVAGGKDTVPTTPTAPTPAPTAPTPTPTPTAPTVPTPTPTTPTPTAPTPDIPFDCKNLKSKCDKCNPHEVALKKECGLYYASLEKLNTSSRNTMRVNKEEEPIRSNITAKLTKEENVVDQISKIIKAGMDLLNTMARDGSTQVQRDGLVRNLEQNRLLREGRILTISELKKDMLDSDKRLSDAADAEKKAQESFDTRTILCEKAIANLNECNLSCPTGPKLYKTGGPGGLTEVTGSGEVKGGATGPSGPIGAVGPTEPGSSGVPVGGGVSGVSNAVWWISGGYSGLAYWDAASKAEFERSSEKYFTGIVYEKGKSPSTLSSLSGGSVKPLQDLISPNTIVSFVRAG